MTTKTHLFMLDDNALLLRSVKAIVKYDYEFHGYETPDEFIDAVLDHKTPAILVIDHDLGQGQQTNGLHVTEQIRKEHTFGLLLPVIYYSARCDPPDYVQGTIDHLMFAPNVLVSKAAGGTEGSGDWVPNNTENLEQVLDAARDMLDQVLLLAAQQGLEQALHSPGTDPDFDLFADEDDREES